MNKTAAKSTLHALFRPWRNALPFDLQLFLENLHEFEKEKLLLRKQYKYSITTGHDIIKISTGTSTYFQPKILRLKHFGWLLAL